MGNYWNILKKIRKENKGILKSYGLFPAFYNLLWWLNFYVPSPFRYNLSKIAIRGKTAWLTKYIEKNYKSEIKKYCRPTPLIPIPEKDIKIWVFWGQGENYMPTLIKACYKQLTSNYDNVVLVTKENISQYVDISPEIIIMAENGQLSWAHFSDILRNKLLFNHGGLWLDATVWVTNKIPYGKLMQMPFFTANGKVVNTKHTCCFWTSLGQNWSSWCMWSNCLHYPLFGFVGNIMEKTALSKNAWPDYVFQDFLIYYAINHSNILLKDMVNSEKISCNNRNKLASLMGQPYNMYQYKELCKNDFVFKLSYRTSWSQNTSDGSPTYYGVLIENKKS